jgi:hypothetical protein
MKRTITVTLTLCLFILARTAHADDQAKVKELLDKAIKAAGGEEKLNKFQAAITKSKGKFHPQDLTFTMESQFLAPSRSRTHMVFGEGDEKLTMTTVLNGDKGWQKVNDGEAEALEGDELNEERESVYCDWATMLAPLKDKAFQLSALPEIKVDDRAALGLQVMHRDHRNLKLYFDKENLLLVKYEMQVKDVENDKQVLEEVYLSDYKDVQGVKQAMKFQIKWDGKPQWDVTVTEAKLLDKLGNEHFEKP